MQWTVVQMMMLMMKKMMMSLYYLSPPHLPKSSILFSLEAYFPSASLYTLFLPRCT